jgi:hypothetical protein
MARYLRKARAGGSIGPEALEAIGGQIGIAHRVLNVPVAQVMLERAGVLPIAFQDEKWDTSLAGAIEIMINE